MAEIGYRVGRVMDRSAFICVSVGRGATIPAEAGILVSESQSSEHTEEQAVHHYRPQAVFNSGDAMRAAVLALGFLCFGLTPSLAFNPPALRSAASQVSASQSLPAATANEAVKHSTDLTAGQVANSLPVSDSIVLVLFGLVLLIGSRAFAKQKDHNPTASDRGYVPSRPAASETVNLHATGNESSRASETAA